MALRSLARTVLPGPLRRAVGRGLAAWELRRRERRAHAEFRHAHPAVARELDHRLRRRPMDPRLATALRERVAASSPVAVESMFEASPGVGADVAYVTRVVSPDATKDLIALRRAGLSCVAITAEAKDAWPVLEPHGLRIETVADGAGLVGALSRLRPRVIIARRGDLVEVALALAVGDAPVIYRPYDFVLRYPKAMVEEDLRGGSVPHLAEAFVLRHAAGLSHTHDAAVVRHVRTEFGFAGRAALVCPGCMDDFVPEQPLPKLSAADGGIHLVYAAGLSRRRKDPRRFGFSDHYDDFVSLLEQGLHLHVHVAYATPDDWEVGLRHYAELPSRYPNFHLEATVPYRDLVRELTKYDVALCYFPARGSTKSPLFWGNMSNNFYTYIDAGLPVVSAPDTTTMAALVRQHEIGLVVEPGELATLGDTLRDADLDAWRRNVARARPALMHDSRALVELVRSIGGIPVAAR